MNELFKKYIAIFTIAALMVFQMSPALAIADETPTQRETPTQQETPTSDTQTPEQRQTPEPNTEQQQTTSPAPSQSGEATPTPTATPQQSEKDAAREAQKAAAKAAWEAQYYGTATPTTTPTGTQSNGNVGDTQLSTGNGTNNGAIVTNANNNQVGSAGGSASTGSGTGSGATVSNTGNGAVSTNNGSSASVVNNNTNQDNSATVGNNMNQATVTGGNQASYNLGNTTLNTGDANVSGTAVTTVNTNAAGIHVSEFNVVEDQKGDIILTPEAYAANCVMGCAGAPLSASNSGNGAASNNTADASAQINGTTFQNNDATVGNNLVLSANSGNNDASLNTGGNTIINTGDANVSANSLTFANNNIAGNVTYGVINIYGNLEGDIILPEFSNGPVTNGTTASNTGNGALSSNAANTNSSTSNDTFQSNDAVINNNLILDGTTGDNSSNGGTGGNTTINTGATNVDANVLNIANSNISGGTWWLVLVNEAGNWVGKIVGAPDGATTAGSEGTQFTYGPDGQITASNGAANTNNGANSSNNASTSTSTNNSTTQTNNGVINNTLDLSANTGGNNANYNTGGNNVINTGDANIIANLVNFVNNNIVGNGNLVVTVVNVFGSWVGDVVTPGQQKQARTAAQQAAIAQNNGQHIGGVQAKHEENKEETIVQTSTEDENGTEALSVTSTTGYAYRSNNAGYTSGGNALATNETKVAGASTTKDGNYITKAFLGDQDSKKVIQVNLAWILIALPLALILFIGRKVAKRYTR